MLSRLREASKLRQLEWDKHKVIDVSFLGCELAGEVGELCNVIKKLERERLGLPGSRATEEDLAAEMADVIIVLDLIAARFDVDLERAVVRKFNATSDKLRLNTKLSYY